MLIGRHRGLRAGPLRKTCGKVRWVKTRRQGIFQLYYFPEWSMVSPGKIVVDKTWQRYRVGRGVSAAPLRSVPAGVVLALSCAST